MRLLRFSIFFFLVSCVATKFSPQNEYRFSRTYTKATRYPDLPVSEEINVNQALFAVGYLRYNRVTGNLGLETDSLLAALEKSLISHLRPYNLDLDSLEAKHLENFAFSDYYSRKMKLEEFEVTRDYSKFSLLPYLEMSVRSRPEIEGDGLWGTAARTGKRIYWIKYGMIISLRENGQEIFSNGVYYTELLTLREGIEPTFTFSKNRIDSLVLLCLNDFPLKTE